MRIEYVTLKNFGPFALFEQEMDNGLIGIVGRNGAGKSTFVNAVYAVLTNDFSRFDGTKAECIYDQADPKEPSYAEIEAEHEGTRFTLRRSLRPNKSVLTIAGGEAYIKANEIEAKLRDDLGVNMKLVDTYVFVAQWMMFQFLDHTPSQRAEAYKHLCGTMSADKIHDALGQLITNHALSCEMIDNSDELITQIGSLTEEMSKAAKQVQALRKKTLNEKSQTSAKKIMRQREKYLEAEVDLANVKADVVDYEEKVKRGTQLSKSKADTIKLLEVKCEEGSHGADAAAHAIKSWATYETRRSRKQKLIKRRNELKETLQNLQCPKPPEDLDSLGRYTEEIRKNESQLELAEGVTAEFEDSQGGECPVCHQSVTDEFVASCQLQVASLPTKIAALRKLTKAITGYQSDLRDYQSDKEKTQTALESAREELKTFKELKEPEGDKEQLQSEIAAHNELKAVINTDKEALSDIKQKLSNVEGKLTAKQEQARKLTSTITENHVEDTKFEKARSRMKEHDAAALEISGIEGALNEKTRSVADKEKQLAQLRTLKQRRKKLEKVLKVAKRSREAFHWNQLPRMVAQGNLVNMEADINATLEWFGSPFWAEADDNLGFKIHFPGNENARRAESLSGGQKAVLAISFRVAVNSLFGADIGMMWLDEPTAGLDEDHVKYFAEALVRLAAEVRGKRQLVVITHSNELRTSFDQLIEVK